jgi:hypothetical protein
VAFVAFALDQLAKQSLGLVRLIFPKQYWTKATLGEACAVAMGIGR